MSDALRFINPSTVPAPLGPYSHMAVAKAGSELVFVSGAVGADMDGALVHQTDFRLQVRQAFKNLEGMLRAEGLTLADVAFLRGFLRREEDFQAIREERKRWYDENGLTAYPPCSFVVVRGLYDPSCLFEVDALAVRGGRSG